MTDSANLLQASGGAAVVSANDPIGYVADLSGKGHHAVQATAANKPLWRGIPKTLGAEVLTNGRFTADTDWTKGAGWTISAPSATKTAGSATGLTQAITLTPGQTYQINYTMTRTAGSLTPRITGGTTVTLTAKSLPGTYTEVFKAEAGNTTIEFLADASFAGTVRSVTLKPVTAMSNMGAWQFGSPRRLITPAINFTASNKLTVIISTQYDQAAAATTALGVGNWAATPGTVWVGYAPPPVGRIRGDTSSGSITLGTIDQEGQIGGAGSLEYVDCHEFDLAETALADEITITTAGVVRTGASSGSAGGGGNFGNVTVDIGYASYRGITTRVIVINRLLTADEKAAAIAWARQGRVFGCTLGDSTVAPLANPLGVASRVSSFVGGLVTGRAALAESGRRIADMKTFWNALSDKSALQAVFIQIGLNDVKGRVGENTATTAQVIADLQDLVDTVNAAKPSGCKTYICGLTPCKVWLDAATNPTAAYQSWLDVNESIAGSGGSPITGVDGRITSHVAALNDGSGNLQAIYDYNSDGVHESNEARFIIAQAWRAQLEADGLVSA